MELISQDAKNMLVKHQEEIKKSVTFAIVYRRSHYRRHNAV